MDRRMHMARCTQCSEADALDNLTAIELPHRGEITTFYFHNRHNLDCLAKKIKSLRDQVGDTSRSAPLQTGLLNRTSATERR